MFGLSTVLLLKMKQDSKAGLCSSEMKAEVEALLKEARGIYMHAFPEGHYMLSLINTRLSCIWMMGKTVRVHGLVSSPQWNGAVGTCTNVREPSPHSPGEEPRYVIKLKSGKELSLRRACIEEIDVS